MFGRAQMVQECLDDLTVWWNVLGLWRFLLSNFIISTNGSILASSLEASLASRWSLHQRFLFQWAPLPPQTCADSLSVVWGASKGKEQEAKIGAQERKRPAPTPPAHSIYSCIGLYAPIFHTKFDPIRPVVFGTDLSLWWRILYYHIILLQYSTVCTV